MKTFKIITYYAPIGFFGFFAYLIAYTALTSSATTAARSRFITS